MDVWETIRIRCRRNGEKSKTVARDLGLAPNTVRAYLRKDSPPKRKPRAAVIGFRPSQFAHGRPGRSLFRLRTSRPKMNSRASIATPTPIGATRCCLINRGSRTRQEAVQQVRETVIYELGLHYTLVRARRWRDAALTHPPAIRRPIKKRCSGGRAGDVSGTSGPRQECGQPFQRKELRNLNERDTPPSTSGLTSVPPTYWST